MGNICHTHFGRTDFTELELLFLAKQKRFFSFTDNATVGRTTVKYELKPAEVQCDLQHHSMYNNRTCKLAAQEMKTETCEELKGGRTYFDTICFFVQQALGCC